MSQFLSKEEIKHELEKEPKELKKYRGAYSKLSIATGILGILIAGLLCLSFTFVDAGSEKISDDKINLALKLMILPSFLLTIFALIKSILTTIIKANKLWTVFNWGLFVLLLVLPIVALCIPNYYTSQSEEFNFTNIGWLIAVQFNCLFFAILSLFYIRKERVGALHLACALGMSIVPLIVIIPCLLPGIFAILANKESGEKFFFYTIPLVRFAVLPLGVNLLFVSICQIIENENNRKFTIISAFVSAIILGLGVYLLIQDSDKLIAKYRPALILGISSALGCIMIVVVQAISSTAFFKEKAIPRSNGPIYVI